MKTVRRMLYRDVLSSVSFVALAFLSLSFFIDFVGHYKDPLIKDVLEKINSEAVALKVLGSYPKAVL